MTHWAYGTGPAAKDADVVLVMEDIVPFTTRTRLPQPRGQDRLGRYRPCALAL